MPADTIEFSCSSCGRAFTVGADKAGKKVKCPKCATVTKVPEPAATAAMAPPPPAPAADEEDDGDKGGYGIATSDEDLKNPKEEKAARKAAPAPLQRRLKSLADADLWQKVHAGLHFFTIGFGAWIAWFALEVTVLLLGLLNTTDYAMTAKTLVDDPLAAAGATATPDRVSLMIGVLAGPDHVGLARTMLLGGCLALIVTSVAWLVGAVFCATVPDRFGSQLQARFLMVLAPVNILFTVFLRLLPLAGLYRWVMLPLVFPEMAIKEVNQERTVPFLMLWTPDPFWDTLFSILIHFVFYLQPVLIAIFAWTCGRFLRETALEQRGMGLVRMSFGVYFILYAYLLLGLAGTTAILVMLLRAAYFLFLGFQLGYMIRALLVLRTLRAVLGSYLEDTAALEGTKTAPKRKPAKRVVVEEEDDDDEYEDEEDD